MMEPQKVKAATDPKAIIVNGMGPDEPPGQKYPTGHDEPAADDDPSAQ